MSVQPTPLSPEGVRLQQRLLLARQQIDTWHAENEKATKVHVEGVGTTLSTAYEQLRNAAEYTEEHLLLQRTIRRFYKRNISFFDKRTTKNVGEELVIELTQSGYLQNDTTPKRFIDDIEQLVSSYYDVYWQLRHHKVSMEKASEWTLDILSVATEAIFNKDETLQAGVFAEFAQDHYYERFKKHSDSVSEDYGLALHAAVHRALLKSDQAVVRFALLQKQSNGFDSIKEFVSFQKKIDRLFSSKDTDRLVRLITKNGAPLRILRRLIEEYPEIVSQLHDRVSFVSAFEAQTEKEYKVISKKINRGIVRSIIFLFITKVIIGLAIEVPYDYYILGSIIWLPLVINLLFPPLYMATLKLSMKLPGRANTEALVQYVDQLMYAPEKTRHVIMAKENAQSSVLLNVMYGAMFLIVFSLVTLRLVLWEFSWIHIVIFFVFLSTASFLGFRLSRLIREIEMVATNQGVIAVVRDFLYMPFILVGRWLSDKYSRVNIIALILDMAIELPLKTFLRLMRQWTLFLNEKKDQL